VATPGDEVGWRRAPSGSWSQFGNLGAVPSDDKNLAARNTVQHLSPVITQIAD